MEAPCSFPAAGVSPAAFSMECLVNFAQVFIGNVRIHLRGVDTGMAQKRLYAANISAIL